MLTFWTLLVIVGTYGALLEFIDRSADASDVGTDLSKPAAQFSCSWGWLDDYGLPLAKGLCKMWVDRNLPAANLPAVQAALRNPMGQAALAPSAMAWMAMAAAPYCPSARHVSV